MHLALKKPKNQIFNWKLDPFQHQKQRYKINHNLNNDVSINILIFNNTHFLPPPPTLNLKKQISPSSTTYSLPHYLYFPSAFTAVTVPNATKSSYLMTSAQINPFSKSV